MGVNPVLNAVRPPSIGAVDNGRVSADVLVNVGGPSVRLLAPEAALAYAHLRDACFDSTGVFLVVMPGGAYRSYDGQVALFGQRYQTPPVIGRPLKMWNGVVYSLRVGMDSAAVPGTSNHGLGSAVDIAEPIIDTDTGKIIGLLGIRSSKAWQWLLAHAVAYGWSWEFHDDSEPWHLRLVALPSLPPSAPPNPQEPLMAELGYFRDDRPGDAWQLWVVALDATGSVWCCPINDLPDRGKWHLVEPIVGLPPVKAFTALVALMDAQNRPATAAGAFREHLHHPGLQPVTTGGVVW